MTTLVTGAAGFIGYHLARALLAGGERVVGIDSVNAYYDVRLKRARLERLAGYAGFSFHEIDLADAQAAGAAVAGLRDVTCVVHLAAQAGVRYSLVDPFAYVHSNVTAHLAVLEAARLLPDCRHVLYASSSSVYGANTPPFRETDRVDRPQSIYAATKRGAELMSEVYASLHGLPQTGLRFFTVYGPWGRPDMAYFHFADAIMTGRPITLYDGGSLRRDFTYVDDVVQAVAALLDQPPAGAVPHRVLNIGRSDDHAVTDLVRYLEQGLGRKAELAWAPRPKVDVAQTQAVTDEIARLTGYAPRTDLRDGIAAFVAWYRPWFDRNGVSSGEPFARRGGGIADPPTP